MTLPAFKAAGSGHETSIAWPGGHAAGDFGLCVLEHHDGTITTPSGWTVVPGFPVTTSNQSTRLSAFYRFATSGAESDFAVTGSSDHNYGAIVTYTGVNTLNPFHQIATADNVSATTNWAPGMTTLLQDCLIVILFGRSTDVAGARSSGEVNGDLGSLSERFDDGTATGSGGGIVVLDGTKAAKGDVTFTQITLAESSASNSATLALQAADQTFGQKTRTINLGQHRMAIPVKQSTAQSFRVFAADSADGKTGKTGLTVAVTLQKEGETSFSSIAPTVTEIGSGHYNIALTTTHMNTTGITSVRGTATGADPIDCPNCIDVVAWDKADSVRLGLTALPNAAAASSGGLLTSGTGSHQLNPSGGRIGPDWSNVGSPTTTVGLSGTTVKTATDVETDTADIQGRLPAALTAGGKIKASTDEWNATAVATPTTAGVPRVDVKAMEANTITTTAVASAVLTAIRNALLDWAYDTGRTFKGFVRRLGSAYEVAGDMDEGEGTPTTVSFKKADGTTEMWSADIDGEGNRTAVDVGDSEDAA